MLQVTLDLPADTLLAAHICRAGLISDIVQAIRAVPEFGKLRFDKSLTTAVLSAVVRKVPYITPEEQSAIVREAIRLAYEMSDEDLHRIDDDLRYIVANGKKLIKRAPGCLKRARGFFFGKGK